MRNAECGINVKTLRINTNELMTFVFIPHSAFRIPHLSFPLLLTIFLSCTPTPTHHKHIFFRMDTVTEITLSVPNSLDVKPMWRSIDSLLIQYEKRFSTTGEMSEIKTLNERTSTALSISRELGEMLRTGIDYGDSLGGAFDITVLPLKEIWGFCEQCGEDDPLPDSIKIYTTIQHVNYQHVRINNTQDTVFFESPDIRIDVGGIAKGYVLKQLAAFIKNKGIDNFLIAAGGDILASGRKNDGTPWRVGVQHPRNQSELIDTVLMENGVLVTSGDYKRFRIVSEKRYHHIFDPQTGYPCPQNQSLTIRASDPVAADILSTGLFCKPAGQILAFINQRLGFECLIVDSAGEIYRSGGW
jgi:thiamine biosynthesis lipoprotein